ncbi:MAG: SDR family oxidoreductase [Chloroflexi bacterium]|nr:MAG: SDR family oxidoreductase [Chloroflexota bacterium]
MSGRVVMVTGANAGMGKEIVFALAGMGATVVMVCRDSGRGEAARREVQERSGSGDVELLVADLSSQQSIRNLVREFAASHDRLHVLVNNAGITQPRRIETADGLESVFATNHLGPFLLTNLLLPLLTASAPSRVVTVASGAHTMGKIDFDDVQASRRYNEIAVYNQSKLANLLFTYELARRIAGTGVSANAADPGFVKTNLRVPFPYSIFSFMRGAAVDGARPAVFLASSPEVGGVSGRYFGRKGEVRSSKASLDEADARRLWTLSAQLTHLDAEG